MRPTLVCTFAALSLTLALTVSSSYAATHKYVDCTNGDDDNNGSISSKWKTIQHAASTISGGDVVHISGGPCEEKNITFSASVSGDGTNCRESESHCTVFKGDPDVVAVTSPDSSPRPDGFILGNSSGVPSHLKIENIIFTVTGSPARAFNEPLKINPPPTPNLLADDIYLKNVSVDGAHDSGIKIQRSQNVLVEDGYVRGVIGDGYQIRGSTSQPTSNITFRNVQSVENGVDGFVVPRTSSEVQNLVFDRTRASGNGTVENGDGYDVRGSASVPSPTPGV